jgi:D-3-phosphoglycerate dehydrogenase
LVIDEVHPILLEKLNGHSIEYKPNIDLDELRSCISEVEILIVRSKLSITKEWMDLAPKLEVIGRLGSGMDNVDLEYATQQNITCFNAPEGNRNAVAEQTLGMILTALSKTSKSAKEVSEGIWDRKGNSGVELDSLTVGIIGFGNVGNKLAQKLRGFECQVLAYDMFKSEFGDEHVQEVTLEELFEQADIISMHVPLNKFSYHMINNEFIESMKKPFYFFNLSRGNVVITSDLIKGLESKKILGCGLDVLENENIDFLTQKQRQEFSYLIDNKDVVITPHIGGLTENSFFLLAEILANKILNWAKKHPLVN